MAKQSTIKSTIKSTKPKPRGRPRGRPPAKEPSATPSTKRSTENVGFVDSHRTYTLPGLCSALGVEERIVREARMNGLVVRMFGGRKLIISGAEFNRWVVEKAPLAPVPQGKAFRRIEDMTDEEFAAFEEKANKAGVSDEA
jgi:hypothetical protein